MHQLLAIVTVEKEDRVQCQQPGCGKGVDAHVVKEDGKLKVLGVDADQWDGKTGQTMVGKARSFRSTQSAPDR